MVKIITTQQFSYQCECCSRTFNKSNGFNTDGYNKKSAEDCESEHRLIEGLTEDDSVKCIPMGYGNTTVTGIVVTTDMEKREVLVELENGERQRIPAIRILND